MWKKEDGKPQGMPEISTTPAGASSTPSPSSAPIRETPRELPVSSNSAACISQGIKIKGEVTGSEDLFVDGQVDGKLSLTNGSLTIGPNGNVKADVTAREVIVRGKVEAGKHPGKTGEAQAAAAAGGSSAGGKSSGPISLNSGTAAD